MIVLTIEEWRKKLSGYRHVLSEMSIRYAQEWVLEEDMTVHGRIKSETTAKPIGKRKMRKVKPASKLAELRYYMDGMQRTPFIGYVSSKRYVTFAPIHFHLSGVVIIEYDRTGNHQPVYGPIYREKILIPSKKLLPRDLVEKYEPMLEETISVGKPSWDYRALRQKAIAKSSQLRRTLEEATIMSFKKTSKPFVVIDGPIDGRVLERKDAVGIIKTHMRQYLTRREEMEVFDMDAGMYSWVFEIPKRFGGKDNPVYSLYMKLHGLFDDPFHGLIRIEINPAMEKSIDEICTAVYDLREPVVTRTQSWDRKIYPIYLCERYLKANSPSINAVRAALV